MITPVRWRAVLIGGAAGLLSTVLGGFIVSLAVGALGAAEPFALGLVVGGIAGLFVAGFTAAKFVYHQRPLNGSLAALATAAVVGTDALLRGSGARPLTLAGYALLAALLGGIGGVTGGRGPQ